MLSLLPSWSINFMPLRFYEKIIVIVLRLNTHAHTGVRIVRPSHERYHQTVSHFILTINAPMDISGRNSFAVQSMEQHTLSNRPFPALPNPIILHLLLIFSILSQVAYFRK